ncbi:MAG: hypothetical protein H6737_14435 [Alphaproteobacteria bacterium]|nr:hypothetical protein [Alphaproteobacteria bacterium]
MLWLLTIVEAFGGCAGPTHGRDLDAAHASFADAWQALDTEGVSTAVRDMEAAIDCQADPLLPGRVATYFQLAGLAAWLDEDLTAALQQFHAAHEVAPDAPLVDFAREPGSEWAAVYEQAAGRPASRRIVLAAPADGWLQVDGTRAGDAPDGRPWVLQRFDPSGVVVSTHRIATGGAVPTYPVRAIEPVRKGPRTVLLAAGLGGIAAGAAGIGGAAAVKSRYLNTPDADDAARLKPANIALGAGGIAFGIAGAGLTVGAFAL